MRNPLSRLIRKSERTLWFFMAIGCAVAFSSAAASDIRVEVEGAGETIAEARLDAIQQALQRAVRQLVIADRIIEDGTVAMDRILSTFNGHISGFELLDRAVAEDGSVIIRASIAVSTDSIENFLSYRSGRSARLDGESLFAEVQRSREQLQVVEAIFRRTFDSYPTSAILFKPEAINAQPNGRVQIVLRVHHSDDWFRMARESLGAVAANSWWTNPDRPPDDSSICIVGAKSRRGSTLQGRPDAICYQLPPITAVQQLTRRGFFGGQDIAIFWSVLDVQGEPVMRNSLGCGIRNREPGELEQWAIRFGGSFTLFNQKVLGRPPNQFNIPIIGPDEDWNFAIETDDREVNLSEAAHVIAMVVVRAPDSGGWHSPRADWRWRTGPFSAPMTNAETCEYLRTWHAPVLSAR